MATTRIMPLRVGNGRTESRTISDIIDYVANPQKTDNGRLITGFACDSRTVDVKYNKPEELFDVVITLIEDDGIVRDILQRLEIETEE